MYGTSQSESPSVLNFFGFNAATLSAKLLMMLRYGNFVSNDTDASIYGRSYGYRDWETDRKSTRLNSSHSAKSRMPSSA